ncbi:hypothetical protein MTO96_037411 [Rhipicephalus appendiculatus]
MSAMRCRGREGVGVVGCGLEFRGGRSGMLGAGDLDGKHYVQSECAGPPNPPCPASSTITGFTGSIQDADSPEWDLVVIPRAVRPPSPRATLQRGPAAQLRGGDAVPVPAVVEKMTFTPRGMEACLSLTSGLGYCRETAALHSPYSASSGCGHYA